MFRYSISSLIKFLAGILLVQGATAMLVFSGMEMEQKQAWLLLAALGLVLGVLSAFWFASVAGHLSKDQLARAEKGFSRERERIRVRAEREKTKVIKQSHQQIDKERNRVQSKANLKVGLAFAGAVGVGLVMMLTQFVTLGLLTLATTGGAVGGYLFRGRRDQKAIAGKGSSGIAAIMRQARGRLPGTQRDTPSRLVKHDPGKS